MISPVPRVWLRASTGFGHAVACNALDHGEIVVATMRDPSVDSLASKYPGYTKKGKLLILKLDVTNLAELGTVFETVRERLGRVDVVFNNAGCMQTIGEVEQVPENLGRSLFDTNFWGAVNVSKESIKFFRQNSPPGGRLLQNSSGSALQGIPGSAYYSASTSTFYFGTLSKAALESFTEALSEEIDPNWNIKITIVEPGPFNTKVIKENLTVFPPHPAYTDPKLGVNISRAWMTPAKLQPIAGNVAKGAALFYRLSVLEDPPFRLPLHPRVLERARHHIRSLQGDIDGYASWSEEIF